jgi:transketolase
MNNMLQYNKGISYLRTTRAQMPVIYDNNERFPVGGCKVLRESAQDKACIVAAGITLHEALKAADELKKQGIDVAIIDLYSIKPFDVDTVTRVAQASSSNRIVVVEDHYQEGGIAETLAFGLINTGIKITSLAVTVLPRSGKPEELLRRYGIDARAIVRTIKTIV